MSLNNGLIHPGNKSLNVEPTRIFNFSEVPTAFPIFTRTVLETYTKGEIVWDRQTRSQLYVIKQDIPVGLTFTYNIFQPPSHPDNANAPFYVLNNNNNNIKVLNPIYGSDWNKLRLTVSPFPPYNSAELMRRGVFGQWGAVVYNKPIPNNWLTLNIEARTSIAGGSDALHVGLVTDASLINQTTTPIDRTALFGYANISSNTIGFVKRTNGVDNFNVSTGASINKSGNITTTSLTFQRESISSESIRMTGSINGVFYTSAYQANALPLTGESYIMLFAWGSDANITVSDVSYYTTK
jgi:hypothetical protein